MMSFREGEILPGLSLLTQVRDTGRDRKILREGETGGERGNKCKLYPGSGETPRTRLPREEKPGINLYKWNVYVFNTHYVIFWIILA